MTTSTLHQPACRRPPAPGARGRLLLGAALLAVFAWDGCRAAAADHLGSIVVDLGSSQVLHAFNATRPLVPASLTKLMSAYVLFEAMEKGEIVAGTRWQVSATAAAQPPSRFGFRKGESVSVETALAAMVVASGNDAAVVVAEGVAGSERAFAARMNDAARRLGMSGSVFVNASGLPAPGQRSTARDMAVLARALWRRFPQHGAVFSRTSVQHEGRRQGTTNPFLSSYAGASGMKTGFTCRAGYNLVASVRRGARHLVAVVMGSPTPAQRAGAMRRLMDAAVAGRDAPAPAGSVDGLVLRTGAGDALGLSGAIVARTCLIPGGRSQEPQRWTVDIGVERTYDDARKTARQFIARWRPRLRGARAIVIPRYTGVDLFRAGVTGLSRDLARDTCLSFRKQGGDCIIMDTPVAVAQLEHARRVLRLSELHARSEAAASSRKSGASQ